MNFIKRLYHWSSKKTDQFLLQLCREDKLWLAVPLSSLARKFFLREFSVKQINYRNVEELKQLVTKATNEDVAKSVENHKNACIPPGLKVLMIFSKYVNNSKDCIESVNIKTRIFCSHYPRICKIIFYTVLRIIYIFRENH